jgi:hypothetical protein
MIAIGRLAEKYGVLPSVVEQTATTYDYMIMDVLQTYENFNVQQANGLPDASCYDLSVDELQDMMEKARGK